MSKYIAYLIDTLNHDCSISDLLSPYDRIKKCVQKYNDEPVSYTHLDVYKRQLLVCPNFCCAIRSPPLVSVITVSVMLP